ncbi:MAG: PEP-CTERM sorting domain-containing protein [Pirellulaceae bacterium]|nr:PEP-CTERM sorting domain-containing protein [Pirellulaceae bacterium]
MHLKNLCFVVPLLACLSSNPSHAGIVIRIDMDSVLPGIQSTVLALPGATITAGLWMELTSPSSISSYNFSVRYDSNELTFASRSETPGNLTGLSEIDNGAAEAAPYTINGVPGMVLSRFDGATLGNGPVGPFGPVKVAEVNFTSSAIAGDLLDLDIVPGTFDTLFNEFFDNNGNFVNANIQFFGGSVTAVPEPSSMMLLGGATAALAWRRNRKLKA